jgi:hypothetical protein
MVYTLLTINNQHFLVKCLFVLENEVQQFQTDFQHLRNKDAKYVLGLASLIVTHWLELGEKKNKIFTSWEFDSHQFWQIAITGKCYQLKR